MATTWPVTLPPSAKWGWSSVPVPNTVATNNTTRQKYTKPIRTYSLSVILTSAQLAQFLAFWEGPLKNGADKFAWERPYNQAAQNFKPVPGTTYSYNHIEADLYNVSFQLMEVA